MESGGAAANSPSMCQVMWSEALPLRNAAKKVLGLNGILWHVALEVPKQSSKL